MSDASSDEVQVGLPSHRVWELARMPASTLNYWVQTGLVRPSHRRQEGRRVEQWWSVQDVVIVKTIRALRLRGATLQEVRRAKRLIEAWGGSIAGVRLSYDGDDIRIVDPSGAVVSGSRLPGQGVLTIVDIPIDEWRADIQADPEAQPVDLEDFRQRARERRKQQRARRRLSQPPGASGVAGS